MLSNYQQKLAKELGVKVGGDNLCLTFKDKKKIYLSLQKLETIFTAGVKVDKSTQSTEV